jgi:hypothetical protein
MFLELAIPRDMAHIRKRGRAPATLALVPGPPLGRWLTGLEEGKPVSIQAPGKNLAVA